MTWKSASRFSEKISFGDVSNAIAQTYIEKKFVSGMDFIALTIPNKENTSEVRARGMSPHLRISFQGGTRMAKKKAKRKKK